MSSYLWLFVLGGVPSFLIMYFLDSRLHFKDKIMNLIKKPGHKAILFIIYLFLYAIILSTFDRVFLPRIEVSTIIQGIVLGAIVYLLPLRR